MNFKVLVAGFVLTLLTFSCGLAQEKHSSDPNKAAEIEKMDLRANEEFKNLFFADQTLEEFAFRFKMEEAPAKDNFAHYFALALDNVRKKKPDDAKKNLQYILSVPKMETRVQIWAWNALRGLGEKPKEIDAREVRGVVIEVPMEDGYDILAVYADGSVRYVNYTGSIAVWDAPDDRFYASIKNILDSAKPLVNKSSVLEKHKNVAPGFIQISILTFGGIYQINVRDDEMNEKSAIFPFYQEGGKIIYGLAQAVK